EFRRVLFRSREAGAVEGGCGLAWARSGGQHERLEITEPSQLQLHLGEQTRRQLPEASPQATVVDRPVLIDHDLALSRVPRDSLRNRNPEQAVARQPRRAGENPGGGMAHRIEKVGLDDDNGSHLSWLRHASWTQVGEVQRTVLDGHLNRALRPRGDRGPPDRKS